MQKFQDIVYWKIANINFPDKVNIPQKQKLHNWNLPLSQINQNQHQLLASTKFNATTMEKFSEYWEMETFAKNILSAGVDRGFSSSAAISYSS